MPASTKPPAFRQSRNIPANLSGQSPDSLGLREDIPSTTSCLTMTHDLENKLMARICAALNASNEGHSALTDYLKGAGMAFDPFPVGYVPTFIEDDMIAFALDMGFVNNDYQRVIPSIKMMERVSAPHHGHSVKTIYGKAGRLSEKA